MSGPPKTPPAPLDARQLAETIDTIGLLVASLSDRVDAQGRLLEKIHQTATEARAAAFAAERATDWKRNGDLIDQGVARGNRFVDTLVETMDGQINVANAVFEEVKVIFALVEPQMRKRQERLERERRWMPALLLGAVSVGVVLTLLGLYAIAGS
jgi:uncharacterized membrane protein YccC